MIKPKTFRREFKLLISNKIWGEQMNCHTKTKEYGFLPVGGSLQLEYKTKTTLSLFPYEIVRPVVRIPSA